MARRLQYGEVTFLGVEMSNDQCMLTQTHTHVHTMHAVTQEMPYSNE